VKEEREGMSEAVMPRVLGRCRLKEKVGEGAMGVVYLAEHATLQIPVAVKVLSERVVREGGRRGALRFIREARIAARLHHPNIVRVYDCGRQGELYYLVMDYVEGESCLGRIEREGRYPWREAVRIARAVAEGLQSAAEQGVIHRDIKPGNILIDARGVPRITDLGVAKISAGAGSYATVSESMLGTPYYISPEQAKDARNVDLRSDIYSLGATLYHMICGEPPFDGNSIYEVVNKHIKEPVPSPREWVAELPQGVCDVIARMMAKRPEDRYQDYGELITDLTRVLNDRPVLARGSEQRLRTQALLAARSLAELRGGKALRPDEIDARPVAVAAELAGWRA